METLAKRIEKDGFAIVPGVLPIDEVEILIEAVLRVPKSSAHKRGGIRNLLNQMIEVRLLANSEPDSVREDAASKLEGVKQNRCARQCRGYLA